MAKNRRTKDENETATVDYRKPVPNWVRAAIDEHMGQACLRPRDRFWDIPVPKIYHEVEDTLVVRGEKKTLVF